MKNIVKYLQDKTAHITVHDNIITIVRKDGKTVVFEANKEDYQIKYNTGNLGGLVDCGSGIPIVIDASPTDFVNGEKYIINYVELLQDAYNKADNTYSKVFLELMPKEDVFADITLKSDVIKVYVNGEILQEGSRRIFAGYYKRYDGMAFYVIDVVKDLETGGDVVICRRDSFNNQEYFTLTREAFCSKVEYGGKTIKKYYRTNKRSPISEKEMQEIAADNYPIKIRRTLKEDELHYTRQSDNYDDYARDILKWYRRDVEAYKLTKQQGALVGIEQYEDYLHIQEDIQFLHLCLKTTLTKYAKFFKEHYVKGKSLRKYAEENNLNRGSVEYLQKRLIVEFSSNLLDRDVSEGKCRLKVD